MRSLFCNLCPELHLPQTSFQQQWSYSHLKIHKMTWLEENSESEGHNSARRIQVSICRPGHSKGFKKVCEDDFFLYVLSSAQVVFYSNHFFGLCPNWKQNLMYCFCFFVFYTCGNESSIYKCRFEYATQTAPNRFLHD